MRDWKSLIEQRLAKLKLPKSEREEVVTELAAHLEDLSEDEKARGVRETESTVNALYESTDWRKLARGVQKSKRDNYTLNSRSKTFWLPALVTLGAAEIFWAVLMRSALYERLSSSGVQPAALLFATLPFIGALGAYLSRRGGGKRFARMIAGIFPLVVMFGVLAIVLFANFITGRAPFAGYQHLHRWIFLFVAALLPILAALVGTLPFLRGPNAQNAPRQDNESEQGGAPCGNR
jgi:hypothetical protein